MKIIYYIVHMNEIFFVHTPDKHILNELLSHNINIMNDTYVQYFNNGATQYNIWMNLNNIYVSLTHLQKTSWMY